MRTAFQQAEGRRGEFTSKFKRFGFKRGFKGFPEHTILLTDVKDQSGKVATDHLWFTAGKQFKHLQLKEGDTVAFTARITEYEKGYRGGNPFAEGNEPATDYRLSFPTNVRKVVARDIEDLPLFAHKT